VTAGDFQRIVPGIGWESQTVLAEKFAAQKMTDVSEWESIGLSMRLRIKKKLFGLCG